MGRGLAATVSSPPLGGRSSRYGKWRAVALGSVYVLFGLHIAHWKLAGTTLAPLELNEVMYTLEAGVVTAGFLLMATLALATAIFGRFFCSWACHILALEDLCSWILRKLRVRVQPVRSRVLMLVPSLALFYMFVWPQLLRLADGRPLPRWRVLTDADGWASFVTNDFWRNLPDPWIAGMTFAVCGFAMVYVLGSRSFCLHACPYGALFGAVDRLAPGRIKLTGDCRQCATCTAVCTSHVRVHEEIALYGKVVDPNCMKDLDCVASCPQQALSYGFTRPAPLASFKSGRRGMKPTFSLTEDVVMAVVFVLTVLVFRGLYTAVPFLMTLGLGGILTYLTVVGLRLSERPDVRLIRFRLKRAGQLTGSGRVFVAGAVLFGLFFAHSAYIRYHEHRGQQALEQVKLAQQSGSEIPLVSLGAALHHLSIARHRGLFRPLVRDHQLASLYLKSNSPAGAEPCLPRILLHEPDDVDSQLALAQILMQTERLDDAAQHAERALATLQSAVASDERPAETPPIEVARVYELLGRIYAARGEPQRGMSAYRNVLEREPDNAAAHSGLAELLAGESRFDEAVQHFRRAIDANPDSASLRYNMAVVLAASGDEAAAVESYRASLALAPDDIDTLNNLGFLLIKRGEPREAEALLLRVVELQPGFAHARFNLGGVYESLGDLSRARSHFREAARLDPSYAEYLGSAVE